MIPGRILALLFPVLLITPSVEAAFPFTGKVVAVLDGDTIEVLHNGKAERIRLNGVDCPEKKQAFGQKAKQFTSSLVFGKTVMVVPREKDRYKRTIGDVFLPNGVNLSYELVREGLAWWYRKYSDDVILAILELEAQLERKGLWIDPRPVPPWEWRKARRGELLGLPNVGECCRWGNAGEAETRINRNTFSETRAVSVEFLFQ